MAINSQPIYDFKHVFSADLSTGEVTVDFVLDNNGDLALVSGIDRLYQMIIFWLLTPLGSVAWDPTYGNPYFSQLGRPIMGNTQQLFLDMLDTCEKSFIANQVQAYAAGTLTNDELVDHFADNNVIVESPGRIVVSFTVVAVSGAVKQGFIPFASNLAAGQALPFSS